MHRKAAVLAAATMIVVASASATESTIVPGVGIGKVKLGMTQAQVVRVLGKDYIVNERATVNGSSYRELAWNFATWSVGLLREGTTWRVVQVETTLSPQRTLSGVGVSSRFKEVVGEYPHAFCGGIYTSYGADYQRRSGDSALILVNRGPVYTAFAVKPATPNDYNGVWRVFAVIVQRAVPGHLSLVPLDRCRDGWRDRGTP